MRVNISQVFLRLMLAKRASCYNLSEETHSMLVLLWQLYFNELSHKCQLWPLQIPSTEAVKDQGQGLDLLSLIIPFANIPHVIWQNNEKKLAGIIGHVSKNYQSQKLIFLGKQYVTSKLLVTNNEWKFQKPQKGRRLFTCKFKKHHYFPGIPKTRGVSV